MSMGKNSGSTSQQQSSNTNSNYSATGSGTANQTPNNLPFLQQGWNAVSQFLGGTMANGIPNATNGINLTSNAGTAGVNSALSGLNNINNIVTSGAPNAGNAYLTPFANGSMSGNNPNFQNVVNQISQADQASTDGGMAAAGRYGSGANANAFNSSLANTTGQLAYQNYGDALNRQLTASQGVSANSSNSTTAILQALGIMPSVAQTGTNAGAAVAEAGAAPIDYYAQIMNLLGNGGGNVTSNQTQSGTQTGQSSGTSNGQTSQTGFGFSLPINPVTLFGP